MYFNTHTTIIVEHAANEVKINRMNKANGFVFDKTRPERTEQQTGYISTIRSGERIRWNESSINRNATTTTTTTTTSTCKELPLQL
jgi:hypothetical protein